MVNFYQKDKWRQLDKIYKTDYTNRLSTLWQPGVTFLPLSIKESDFTISYFDMLYNLSYLILVGHTMKILFSCYGIKESINKNWQIWTKIKGWERMSFASFLLWDMFENIYIFESFKNFWFRFKLIILLIGLNKMTTKVNKRLVKISVGVQWSSYLLLTMSLSPCYEIYYKEEWYSWGNFSNPDQS